MCSLCDNQINTVWSHLKIGQCYRTPDKIKGKPFKIILKNNAIKISPQNITVKKEAFSHALHYLHTNGHYYKNPCKIGSNKDPKKASSLCRAARKYNNNVMCINHILPILEEHGVVGIDSKRPNKTWLKE